MEPARKRRNTNTPEQVGVRIWQADGKIMFTLPVPDAVASRCAILRAILDSQGGDCVLPCQPSKFMKWMGFVTSEDSFDTYEQSVARYPLDVLQVATFLDDKQTGADMVGYASSQVLVSSRVSQTRPMVNDLPTDDAPTQQDGFNEGLQNLSEDLQQEILSTAPCTLLRLLATLPQSLHASAICSHTTSNALDIASYKDTTPATTAASLQSLSQQQTPLSQLTSLSLTNLPVTTRDVITSLGRVLASVPCLISLDVSHLNVYCTSTQLCSPSLGLCRLTSLHHLNLSSCGIKHHSAPRLAHTLSCLTALTALHMDDNPLGNDSFDSLASCWPRLPELRVLTLSKCAFPATRARKDRPLLPDTLHHFCKQLASCTNLRVLRLDSIEMDRNATCCYMLLPLVHLPLLEVLGVSSECSVQPAGTSGLDQNPGALTACAKRLTDFTVTGCDNGPSLRTFWSGLNRLTALTVALEPCRGLEKFGHMSLLRELTLGEASQRASALSGSNVSALTCLTRLDVVNCVPESHWVQYARFLAGLTTLTQLQCVCVGLCGGDEAAGDDGAELGSVDFVGEPLAAWSNLRDLAVLFPSRRSVVGLGPAWISRLTGLHSLDLCVGLSNPCCLSISANPSLSRLVLHDSLSRSPASMLVARLAQVSSLRTLHVSAGDAWGNQLYNEDIGTTAHAFLADVGQKLTALRELKLDGKDTHYAIDRLACLSSLTTLERLDVAWSADLGTGCALESAALAAALERLSGLSSLHLRADAHVQLELAQRLPRLALLVGSCHKDVTTAATTLGFACRKEE